MRRAPNVIRRRLHYRWQPKALRWDYLRKYHPSKPLITPLDGCLKVRIYPKDVIGRYIYIDGVFERDCSDFVKAFLRPGMIAFDIGANLGQYTVLAAHRVGQQGQVHSFEPCERMFHELEFNVGLNGLSHICTLNRVAVSNTVGVATLSRYEEGAEVYGSLGAHKRSEAEVVGHEDVQIITLDDYIEEKAIDRVDLIKMDIEGAELLALKGAQNLLSRDDAPTILLEMADINTEGFGYKAVEIWDFLTGIGYRIHGISASGEAFYEKNRPADFAATTNVVASKILRGRS